MTKNKIQMEDLSGLKAVHDIMVNLSLPDLQPDVLLAVGKTEGDDFKKAILKIANDEDNMQECRGYVTNVTSLLTGAVGAALAEMGYVNIQRDVLIKIGKDCGMEFRKHLSDATRKDQSSIEWIQKKITEYGAGNSEFQPTNSNKQSMDNRQTNTPVKTPQHVRQEEKSADTSGFHDKYPRASKNSAGQGSETNNDREFFSMTFYGAKSALCFNAVEKDGEHSINLDGGNKKPGQPDGGRAIDWNDKVIFGFSADELIEFAWVLMGLSQSCDFSGHGPLHDKSFQFKRQDKGFFGSVSAKDKGSRAVPLSYAAGARLMFLVSRQLQKNYPSMTVSEVLNMLKMMANKAVRA